MAPHPENPSPQIDTARAGGPPWLWQKPRAWLATHIGLEGRILGALMLILTAALAASSWVWASQSTAGITDMMGEQARQIAYTLSLAAKPEISAANTQALQSMGADLLKTRNILFVAFFNTDGKCIALSHRDPDQQRSLPSLKVADVQSLTQVKRQNSPVFGNYLEVIVPILEILPVSRESSAASRLVGYVSVGVSPAREEAQMRRIDVVSAGIGCALVLASMPMAYLLVRRIFRPIRQLVHASERIAAGELDTRVAIHRHDAIGDLARAFNEMVKTVKQQREALQLANVQLEEKVTQRTAQLETANKRLSNEIAEKEDFLRAVSHDLNAPLRNIAGMATTLLLKHREKLDEDAVHRLERIQRNVEAETDLIAELLELSRIKTRRQKMEMVEIAALVRELEGIFESDLKNRKIALVIDTDLPVLYGERARFRQVFQNLIDNAIKYMGEGPVRQIHVGCKMRKTEAEFYVRDTGLGIDEEDIGKVFFVFRRGKSSTNIAGKGVGLASVKSIVETYSGTIWVQSRPGEGSTFRFTINGQHVPALQHGTAKDRVGPPAETGGGAVTINARS